MPRTIEPRQEAIDALYARVFGEPKTEHSNSNRQNGHHLSLEDDVLLRKAFGAKNGHKIKALYEGDISAYPSHSEADLALCSFLVFYTQEEAQLDRLCRASKLYRDKWDKKHYGGKRQSCCSCFDLFRLPVCFRVLNHPGYVTDLVNIYPETFAKNVIRPFATFDFTSYGCRMKFKNFTCLGYAAKIHVKLLNC